MLNITRNKYEKVNKRMYMYNTITTGNKAKNYCLQP